MFRIRRILSTVYRLPYSRVLIPWFFAVGFAWLIWYVSSLPLHGPVFETAAKKHFDKVVHAVEYGLFALLLFEAFRRAIPGKGRVRRALVLAAFVAAVYAVTDEIHQSGVPFRSCDMTDVWADMSGITLALAARLRRLATKHA